MSSTNALSTNLPQLCCSRLPAAACLLLTSVVLLFGLGGCVQGAEGGQPQNFASAALVAPVPIPIPNQRPPTRVPIASTDYGLTTPVPSKGATVPEQPIDPFDNTRSNPVTATHPISTVIGLSTGGLPIVAYHFGNGPQRVAFVGGIHGGSEWNSVLLAYRAIDYFSEQPADVPANLTLQIIPVANPDGLFLVTGKVGRFQAEEIATEKMVKGKVATAKSAGRVNENGVDLNRNWDCAWTETAWWGTQEVSAGTAPFSEVETRVLRDFFLRQPTVAAVIFWHSAVPGVFAGGCTGIYPAAERLAEVYATAANYPYGEAFSHYPITGDATNWLSNQQIPAIVVELATAYDPEWPQNLAGMQATLALMANTPRQQLSTPHTTTSARSTEPRKLAE